MVLMLVFMLSKSLYIVFYSSVKILKFYGLYCLISYLLLLFVLKFTRKDLYFDAKLGVRMETTFWEDPHLIAPVKFENHIGYSATPNSEDEEYGFHGKKKISRDPLSHRIIEKRRRDRMNSCLADLSRLIPHEYMKKGRGRVEKTEIIEMAIRRIKHLMGHAPCTESECHREDEKKNGEQGMQSNTETVQNTPLLEHLATSYRLGFAECLSETVHFLVQVEGMMASDPFCSQLRSHLTRHCDHILQSESLRSRLCIVKEEYSVPYVNENDQQQQNCTSAGMSNMFDEAGDEIKNGVITGNNYNHIQSCQQQQHVHISGSGHANQSCNNVGGQNGPASGGNQHNTSAIQQQHHHHQQQQQQQQQDSSSEASTTTTGHLSTISNNHSPTSSNSEKTTLQADNEKVPCPTYKFKNRIQKRFERTGTTTAILNRAGSANDNCAGETISRVPVFVLAPRGNYYLPMSMDCGQLPPNYHDRGYTDQADCLVLHPVTISVDFRGGLDGCLYRA